MANVLEQIKAEQAEQRAADLALYREILLRGEKPEPGDAEALREIMDRQGISAGRIETDLNIVRRAAELEAQVLATKVPDFQAKYEAALKATSEHQAKTAKTIQEMQEQGRLLAMDFLSLSLQRGRAREISMDLHDLKRKHPELFTSGEEPVRPKKIRVTGRQPGIGTPL